MQDLVALSHITILRNTMVLQQDNTSVKNRRIGSAWRLKWPVITLKSAILYIKILTYLQHSKRC